MIATLRRLFAYNDWGNKRILDAAEALDDARLDQPLEMGPGSLRATLFHVWCAEQVWLSRWLGGVSASPDDGAGMSVADIRALCHGTAVARDKLLARLTNETISGSISVTTSDGVTTDLRICDMMLHVVDHGVHHRGQASNMLRRLSGEPLKPGLDYLMMVLFDADAVVPIEAYAVELIRRYYAFTDWAREQLFAVLAPLADEQLDRKMDIGVGSLRKTALHMCDAERWWLENWTSGEPRAFQQLPVTTTVAELSERYRACAATRNAFLDGIEPARLSEETRATPDGKKFFSITIGDAMLQLCGHGTHHRAQCSNMLRQIGNASPQLGLARWLRLPDAAA
jgi:uncharacterized damage-inducible protein DinB